MLYRAVLTLAVSLTISVVTAAPWKSPWFCRTYNCPQFSSEDKGDYEIRHYEETNWAATSETYTTLDLPQSTRDKMLARLVRYVISHKTVHISVPFITRIVPQGKHRMATMMTYLSMDNPPAPKAGSGVFLFKRPECLVFVRAFPKYHWAPSKMYRTEFEKLKGFIGNASLHNDYVYYMAEYNSRYEYSTYREYEVWADKLET